MNQAIAARRLQNQRLASPSERSAVSLVSWLGAVQAQEFGPARWGLGVRLPASCTDADIARAFDDGRILRTHVMRPTWHFVPRDDIRWMLALTAPRVHQRMAPYNKRLGLAARLLTRAASILERAVAGGRFLTRPELQAELARAGIDASTQRLGHIVMYAELEQILCSGPRRDRRSTYALLAERAPNTRPLPRDEALALLGKRFFQSHGPATVRDFVWWSGLTTADARRALEMNRARSETIDGLTYWTLPGRSGRDVTPRDVHLLPIYDEYVVAYRDRAAVPLGPTVTRWAAGPATFRHALIVAGQIAGTWFTAAKEGALEIEIAPFARPSPATRTALGEAAERYGRFVGVQTTIRFRR
ncbi:MAG TPA: winged helix DNA-binding domain-containing protein [Vicinamibacterales bacterium]|nr:winged helix DNA-binding domain-containing protein [Vicinamibacterales bacterium]